MLCRCGNVEESRSERRCEGVSDLHLWDSYGGQRCLDIRLCAGRSLGCLFQEHLQLHKRNMDETSWEAFQQLVQLRTYMLSGDKEVSEALRIRINLRQEDSKKTGRTRQMEGRASPLL